VKQLPIFVNLAGQPIILLGDGEAADAKRRLIERAGGLCVGEDQSEARLAFIAYDDEKEAQQAAARLRARGLLINVVDRPTLCDFTTPAIVDRSPVLIAIGTGGASAGLAKAVRQRLERIIPSSLGRLADTLLAARARLKALYPEPADRRRAIDLALDEGGTLDPFHDLPSDSLEKWLSSKTTAPADRVMTLWFTCADPEEMTLRQARLLGQADTLVHAADFPAALLARARADAARLIDGLPTPPPPGLTLQLKLHNNPDNEEMRT
jgi:uroporphyrin-III C-methyltransferase/precorrin-2 dehydrogenase/sirohydrochlorin ferrochelatase